ncbi:MBL fold metallo-hydrolase [Achromobacter aloeverae]|uniref:MBL fold metallo-hydrolase n=1 Tax=Achromobacter aloeverae TaxID=1750518 RepID=A0A4Q1HEE4_9BURK|nr:MBL fold metallo-hydrolase [Achromobacter aloeverae]RXN83822.1 MBL fold metallo-hydrolase [Achromobacter aloeverae]
MMRLKTKLLGLLNLMVATHACAAPPAQVRQQAPGYQRLAVGRYEVTALFDGYTDLSSGLLQGLPPEKVRELLARQAIHGEKMPASFNVFLVNTGRHLVMIDGGAGHCMPDTAGQLITNIIAAGYRPEQIDTVLLTHLHLDHVCGLTDAAGKALFPNATVHATRKEADFWLNPDNQAQAPEGAKKHFDAAREALAPYRAAGRFQTFSPPQAPIPEVETSYATGHTPGSAIYRFASDGAAISFIGDLIHSAGVQFDHPYVSVRFDVDAQEAVQARRQAFTTLARAGEWLAAAHLPFPGIGHVTQHGERFTWVPVAYGPYRRAARVPFLK